MSATGCSNGPNVPLALTDRALSRKLGALDRHIVAAQVQRCGDAIEVHRPLLQARRPAIRLDRDVVPIHQHTPLHRQ